MAVPLSQNGEFIEEEWGTYFIADGNRSLVRIINDATGTGNVQVVLEQDQTATFSLFVWIIAQKTTENSKRTMA